MDLPSREDKQESIPSEKELIRHAYNRVVMEHMPSIINGLLIIGFIFTAFDYIEIPSVFRTRILVHDVVLLFFVGLCRMLLSMGRIPDRFANPTAAVIALMLMSNIIHTYSLVHNQIYSTFLVLNIIGASFVLASYFWYSIILAVGISSWSIMALRTVSVDELMQHGIAFSAAAVIGMLFIYSRLAVHRRLEAYRLRDQESRRVMTAALDDMRSEVLQRRQVEEEKKKLEGQLLQSQKMEAIGRLAGGVAHDMNNMLAAIKSSAEIIFDDTTETSPHWNDLDVILSACKRGEDLTHNLLGFARLGKYRREYINIEDVVREVQALLFRTIPKKIEITVMHEGRAGHIVGDPSQINQVLVNLVLNSVDAMKSGGKIVIRTGRVVLDVSDDRVKALDIEPGAYAKLEVRDSGEGMDADTAARAFEPFFTSKGPGEGTGLGLAMVYGTVKNHGGSVTLKSEPNVGTTVTVLLPEHVTSTIPDTFRPIEKQDRPAAARRILLVDDEPLIRQSIERMLRRMGHLVTTVDGGREAVDRLIKAPLSYDLIMLDLMMPIMDGEETFDALRRIHVDIDILLMSGYTKEAMAERLISKGAIGFVHKPFDFEEVKRLIQATLRPSDIGVPPKAQQN
jgi:signal transduction histidine kinase/ActR/RegA family two-component response regulator